ncbi:MAG: LysM peptidoglycan-binding domain-containing protein [Alteromonadales bacterium]|nr:LysM peptidoglycan-binding domain-containing protein [Alteromonadales bacterium]
MHKKIKVSLFLLFCPLLSFAEQLIINQDAPKTYLVKKGDTLWDISAVFLEQPWLWPQLWRLNPKINNPHLIYPGDLLKLVYDSQGEPVLVVDNAPELEGSKSLIKVKPSYKWSPKIRKKTNDQLAITLLPQEVIAPFLSYDQLVTKQQLAQFPYIIGSNEGYSMTTDGFHVYVNKDLKLAKSYAIYNKGVELVDPETQESLGFYADLAGTAQVIRSGNMADNKPATLKVTSVKQEIHAGSYVAPVHENQLLPSVFTMRPVDESIRGSIIKAVSKGREFGKLEVVMINRGKAHNITIGDVLAIKRPSPAVVETSSGPKYQYEAASWDRIFSKEYHLPEEPIGELMVFKVFHQASMALILRTQKPARLNDVLTAPE